MATETMATLSAKVKPEEKAAFNEVCDSIGLSPSNAIRMFVSAVNKCKGLPFDTRNPYGFNKETLQAMEDSANMVGVSRGFDSIDDMIAELER